MRKLGIDLVAGIFGAALFIGMCSATFAVTSQTIDQHMSIQIPR